MIYALKITLLTFLLAAPAIVLYFLFKLVAGKGRQSTSYGESSQGFEERMRHDERMRELKAQSTHLHERNLYERGHSIYSHKHNDF